MPLNGDKYRNDPEYRKKVLDYQRTYRNKKKSKAMRVLGNKCASCGIDDKRVLQFDHINNDGNIERTSYKSNSYVKIRMHNQIINGDRDDIQLLCANCHVIKTLENS